MCAAELALLLLLLLVSSLLVVLLLLLECSTVRHCRRLIAVVRCICSLGVLLRPCMMRAASTSPGLAAPRSCRTTVRQLSLTRWLTAG
jgi:hypothetical protein